MATPPSNVSKRIVVKDNALIQATYKLTLNEQRMVLCLLRKVNSRALKFPANGITVTPQEVREAFNLEDKKITFMRL